MARIVGKSEIEKKTKKKKELEVDLSHKVYDIFNSGREIDNLRATVAVALESMRLRPRKAFDRALREEAMLQVWVNQGGMRSFAVQKSQEKKGMRPKKTPTRSDFVALRGSVKKFTAADCGDVIRLVGAWVEFGGTQYSSADTTAFTMPARKYVVKDKNREDKQVKDGARAVTPGELVKADYRGGVTKSGEVVSMFTGTEGTSALNQKFTGKANVWAQDAKKYGKEDERDYEDWLMKALYGRHFNSMPARRVRANPQSRVLPPVLKRHKEHTGIAGRQLKCIPGGQGDNVPKVDNLIGLMDVCSISGTTSDVTFLFDQWGHKFINGKADLSRTYYMLPVGSIAGFHHHSILEVALALSLIKHSTVDYRVGFYGTLLPQDKCQLELRTALQQLLMRAEATMKTEGLHFFCFYKEKELAGGIALDPSDVATFKQSKLSKATFLVSQMPGFPVSGKATYEQVMAFLALRDWKFYNTILKGLEAQ